MEESRAKILIVDDEESIRDILCRKLQSQSYECVVATDGNDALWKAFMQDFDIVIMDIKMPGMSGMEVLPKMLTDHPDTCVIMLTAVSDIQTAVEAMKVGAFDYLTKPFNLDDLIMRVDRALERKRLVLENREYQRNLEAKVQRQAGQLQQLYSESAEATNHEQASPAQEKDTPQSLKQESPEEPKADEPQSGSAVKIAKKISRLLSNKTSGASSKEGTSRYIRAGNKREEN